MRIILIKIIRLYQLMLSPYLGQNCRFDPTCSTYAQQALERHGVFKGLFLSVKRILRCHPLGGMGYDPVPGVDDDKDNHQPPSS